MLQLEVIFTIIGHFEKKKNTAALLNSSDKYKRKKTDNDQMKILVHQVIM